MMPQLTKTEKCLGCSKFIWTHNQIMTCDSCKIIAHAKCAKSLFDFNNIISDNYVTGTDLIGYNKWPNLTSDF